MQIWRCLLNFITSLRITAVIQTNWTVSIRKYRQLNLPVNTRAKNMFSHDVKSLTVFQMSNFEGCPSKLKLTWPQTSMFQLSIFEVSPPKFSPQRFFACPYQWFSQVFLRCLDCDDSKLSEPWEHRLCHENFTFGQENFKVWDLKHRRLRSCKLKFGRGNFKVWHLKHKRLTSHENMLLARAYVHR